MPISALQPVSPRAPAGWVEEGLEQDNPLVMINNFDEEPPFQRDVILANIER